MDEPTLIAPGRGEVIGDSPDRRVEILSDRDELHATWSRFGAGREGAGLHIHRRHSDLFYVLDGELTVRLGIEDSAVVVGAGTLARIPPLVVHGFRNAGDADVRYLNFHAPGEGFADYMRGLRDGRKVDFDQGEPSADGVRPADEAVIGGEHLVLDEPGLRVKLLAEQEEIAIAETWIEAGATPPEPSPQPDQVESFYVLEGEIELSAADHEVIAPAGSWLQVPAGMPYAFALPSPRPARFLGIRTPVRVV